MYLSIDRHTQPSIHLPDLSAAGHFAHLLQKRRSPFCFTWAFQPLGVTWALDLDHVFMYSCIHVFMYSCIHVFMYSCMCVRTYVRTYVGR